MKILVVSRLKSNNKISIITERQMNSLSQLGHQIDYFTIKKGGIYGYIDAFFKLRRTLNKSDYDIIHAHYSLAGIISAFSAPKNKLVVSLMGSDVNNNSFIKIFTSYCFKYKWERIIVKSEEMLIQIQNKFKTNGKFIIIPNGVDLQLFKPLDKYLARTYLGWDNQIKVILFASDPQRKEKQYNLALTSMNLLKELNYSFEIKFLKNIEANEVPYYLNASDLLLLTSEREGSPNIIKEAMACNIPIVSTNVGDVEKVISNTIGCYVTSSNDPKIISNIILKVLNSEIKRTNGRMNINWLGQEEIAKKILEFYAK